MVLRHLASHWLRNTAREKLREAAVGAVKEKLRDETEENKELPEGHRADVAVLFALPVEAGGFEDIVRPRRWIEGEGFSVAFGMLHEKRIAIAITGTGREAAQTATEAILDAHKPAWVISTGFAGGLQEDLGLNDLILADAVLDIQGNKLRLDLRVDRAALESAKGVHAGALLTVDRIVHAPGEKRALGEKTGALGVDMETLAVAETCRRREVPFSAVRIVSDRMDDELPNELKHLLSQKSTTRRLGAAVGAVFRKPSRVKDLWNLREKAILASEKLGRYLSGLLR
jgi:adenosylhomocysteine nucleosidase